MILRFCIFWSRTTTNQHETYDQKHLKELLSGLKSLNDLKTFQSSVKLIASNSNIDQAFKSMDQSITSKIKNSTGENWVRCNYLRCNYKA